MIDKLSMYCGLSIRHNFDSVEGIRNAVWVIFYQYSSITKNYNIIFVLKAPIYSVNGNEQKQTDLWMGTSNISYNILPDNVLDAIRSI